MQKKEIFPVTGLGCAACATRVGKVLNAQDGVIEANVNYASATALVEYDPVKSGFLAFIVPKIPSDSRIDLETMIVKTREEAESAMAEWLSSGN